MIHLRGDLQARARQCGPALILSVLATACLDPSDSGSRFGELRVRPVFASGEEPAAIDVAIDSIRTTIRRLASADPPIVDKVAPYGGQEARAWVVELNDLTDDVEVTLELLASGQVVYRGKRTLPVEEGSLGRSPPEDVLTAYVGSDLAKRVEITPARLVFTVFGASRQLTAVSYNGQGKEIVGKQVRWSSQDPSVAVVDTDGIVMSVGTGSTSIVAAVDGVTDTTTVAVDRTLTMSTTIEADSTFLVADSASTSVITVSVLDASSKSVGASAGIVTLATTLGSLSAVTDHLDGTYTATLNSGINPGQAVIKGTLNGSLIADSALVRLLPGQGATGTTMISADSASLEANGISKSVITVVVLDQHGNPTGSSAGSVKLFTSLGTVGAVTDHNDGTYTAALTAGNTTGVALITGTLNNAPIGSAAVVRLRAGPWSARTTTITADPELLLADGAGRSGITVVVNDENGNPVGRSVGVATLATTLGTLGPVTDNDDGTYFAVLTAAKIAGTAVITGTLDGVPIIDSATVQMRAGVASVNTTSITADSASLEANGTSASLVTVAVLDANGNAVGASAGSVTLSTTLGTLSAVIDHHDGTYTATLTAGSTTGVAVITGTLDGVAIVDSAIVQLRARAASLNTTTITADSASLEANGTSASLVTVAVLDANGNSVGASAGSIVLTTTLGTLSAVIDHNDGTYTATLTAGTITGAALISGTLNGLAIVDSAIVQFDAGAGSVNTTTITADSASLEANGTSASLVTVAVLDANGNPVGASAGVVMLTTTLGTLSAVIDHNDGTYTATLTADTLFGVAVIRGTLDGVAIVDSAIVQMRSNAATPYTTTITADSASLVVEAESSTTITVEVRDAVGNLVGTSAGTVTLSATLGLLGPVIDHGDGSYTATLRAAPRMGTGLAVITGTLNGVPIADSATVLIKHITD